MADVGDVGHGALARDGAFQASPDERGLPSTTRKGGATVHSTIPETDPPETSSSKRAADHSRDSAHRKSALQNTAQSANPTTSTTTTTNGTGVFETARSHLSPSPRKLQQSQTSSKTPSSYHVTRFRKLTEIATSPTPTRTQNTLDIDLGVNPMTEEDNDFVTMMSASSSPVRPTKRRRVYGRGAMRDQTAKATNKLTAPPTSPPPEKADRSVVGSPVMRKAAENVESDRLAQPPAGKLKRPSPRKSDLQKANRQVGDDVAASEVRR
ncbi:hypothetical protein LTS18_001935, partial [Coniosporium uncinatum]